MKKFLVLTIAVMFLAIAIPGLAGQKEDIAVKIATLRMEIQLLEKDFKERLEKAEISKLQEQLTAAMVKAGIPKLQEKFKTLNDQVLKLEEEFRLIMTKEK